MRRALLMCCCVPEPQLREHRGAREDFPPREGAIARCPLQGQRAASPRVAGGLVVVGEVTLGESMRHVFGGVGGGVPVAVFRGGGVPVLSFWEWVRGSDCALGSVH